MIKELLAEVERAERLHPEWPEDVIHQVAIMVEEAGEAMRAALNYVYHGGELSELQDELVQTGAMVIRCLEDIDRRDI